MKQNLENCDKQNTTAESKNEPIKENTNGSSGNANQKDGGFIAMLINEVKDLLRNPKKLLPTIILSIVWMLFSIMSAMGANIPILRFLYTLTYSNGGMFGGFFGAVGGIFGKAVFAIVVNTLVLSLVAKKNPFANAVKSVKGIFGKAAFSGLSAISPFLIGAGFGLILYWFFNITSSTVNCAVAVVGAVGAFSAIGKKNGIITSLVYTVAGKLTKGRFPSQVTVNRLITGFSAGFALGLPLTFVRFGWLLFLAGAVLLAVGIVLTVIGKNDTKKMAATAAILLIVGTALSPIAFAAEGSGGGFPFEKYEDKKIELGFSEYPTQENSLIKSGETELMINEPIYVRVYENGEIIARQSARLTIKKIPGMYEASLNDYPAFFYEVRLYDEEKKEEQLGVWNDRLERIPKNGIREEDGDITTRTMLSRGNKIVFDEYYEHFLNGVMEWKGHSYECISPVDEFPDLYLYIRCDVSDNVNPSHPEMDAAEIDRLYGLGQQLLDTDYAVKWENDLETTNDGEDAVPTDAKANELSPNGSTGDDAEIPYVPYRGRLTYTNGKVNKHGQPFPDIMDFDGDGEISRVDLYIQKQLSHDPDWLDRPKSKAVGVAIAVLTALLGAAGGVLGGPLGSLLGSTAQAAASAAQGALNGIADGMNVPEQQEEPSQKEDLGRYIRRDPDGDLMVRDPATGKETLYIKQEDGSYRNTVSDQYYTVGEIKNMVSHVEENSGYYSDISKKQQEAVAYQHEHASDFSETSVKLAEQIRQQKEQDAKEDAINKIGYKHGVYNGDEDAIREMLEQEQAVAESLKEAYHRRAANINTAVKVAEGVKTVADVAADVVGTVDKTGIFKDVYSATTAAAGNAGEVMAGNMTAAEAVAKTAVEASTEIIKNRAQSTGAKFAANILGDSAQDVTSAMLEGKDLGEVTDAAIAGAGRGLVDSTVDHVISFGNEAVASSGRQHLTEAGETLASDLAKLALPEVEVPKKEE